MKTGNNRIVANQSGCKSLLAFPHSRILTVILLLSIAGCQFATAQARFSASAPKSVPQNSNFQLSFTLENANGNNLHPPSISDFQVLSGPNTSTSMQWVNGNVTQSVTYNYILRPKNQGTFK